MLLIIGVAIGIVFCIVVQPLLDGLVQTALSYLTLVNSRIAYKISKINAEVSALQTGDESESIPKIGFYMPDENEILEDESDDEEDHHRRK